MAWKLTFGSELCRDLQRKQFRHGNIEGRSDVIKSEKIHHALAPLDQTNVVRGQIATLAELVLAKAPLLAEFFDPTAKRQKVRSVTHGKCVAHPAVRDHIPTVWIFSLSGIPFIERQGYTHILLVCF